MPTISRAAFITALLALGAGGGALILASKPTSSSGGSGVTSVSNSDGSLSVSPNIGAVVASLNTAHANTWSALQTFDANDFAFGGYGPDSITSGAKGDIWYYNGTNLVNLAIGSTNQVLTVSGGEPAWANSGAPVAYVITSIESTTSASLQTSGALSFTAATSTSYFLDATLYWDVASPGSQSFTIGIVAPSGSTVRFYGIQQSAASGGDSLAIGPYTSINTAETLGGNASNSAIWLLKIYATVTTSSTSGTVGIGYGSNGTNTSSLNVGSVMLAYVV